MQTGIRIMAIRVIADCAGVADRQEFHPHLVCSWTLDPASDRLSCAWAPPAADWEMPFLSPRIASADPGRGLAPA
jgi:hypothetical protein